MIKIFDTPEYMSVEEVEEKFYPNRAIIANCEVSYHAPVAGYVMAVETIPDDDFDELFGYQIRLHGDSEKYGAVFMVSPRRPFDGEWLCVEFAKSDKTGE